MATKVTKAIIPIAGLGTRFLPLSKVLPKEFFPLVDRPAIQYIIDEAKNSGIKEIIFVNRPEKKEIGRYFTQYATSSPELKEVLKDRGKKELLQELANLENDAKQVAFTFVSQQTQLGDGHAVLQAKTAANGEPCLVLFGDDIVHSEKPCGQQLIDKNQISTRKNNKFELASLIHDRVSQWQGCLAGGAPDDVLADDKIARLQHALEPFTIGIVDRPTGWYGTAEQIAIQRGYAQICVTGILL